jgi:hypothetical protein
VIAAHEKNERDVRERNSRPVFSESDMEERKRNSTGREVLPARPLRVAWLCEKRRRGFDTAASNPALQAQGEATKPAAWIAENWTNGQGSKGNPKFEISNLK